MAIATHTGQPRRAGQIAVVVLCAFGMHVPPANGARPSKPVAMAAAAMQGAVLLPLDSIAPPSREPPEGSKPPLRVTPGGRLSGRPVVRLGLVEVRGGLPFALVRGIIERNYRRYRLCYEKGLARNRELHGQVALHFVIDRDGRPSSVRNTGSTVPDAQVIDCFMAAIAPLSFPKPDAKSPEGVNVLAPWFLEPG